MKQERKLALDWSYHVNAEGALEITPETLKSYLSDSIQLVDVRRPDEFVGELGHIKGSQLMTLETELETGLAKLDKTKPVVFICRSGVRSTKATFIAQALGFKECYNMQGGMIRWGALDYPIER